MKFGAIDIGTNAARLLVGEVTKQDNHSFVKKISYTRIPLRLGEEVFDKGELSPQKMEDFAKAMEAFKLISEIFQVKQLRACATSAMREASNRNEVLKKIRKRTSIEIEVISGDEEARLIFGTFFLLEFDKDSPFVVIDVGGGSTEVSLFENGKRVAAKSFQVGTLRLLKGKTHENVWKDISGWIRENVDFSTEHQIFATGGNINKVHKLLGAQNTEALEVKKVKKLRDQLADLSVAQRVDKYQLKPDRADVIVPACDIYLYILKQLEASQLFVPKIGLSDGMVYDMYLDEVGTKKK
ncbi:MAG: phosphatase [Bacteroidetes bacterium]|nr:MAG: phosphatase [Bacteroidota bacterium]